jgi:hypothetical protein
MIGQIEPFTKEDVGGYQWLDELVSVGNIDFLFSSGGTW